jgi:membrane protease YdiL (CAAX protease family)
MPAPQTPPFALVAFVCFFLSAAAGAWLWAISRLMQGHPLLPEAPPRKVPWGIGSVLAVVLVWVLLQLTLFPPLNRLIMGPGHTLAETKEEQPEAFIIEQLLLIALVNAGMVVLVPALLKASSRAGRGELGLGPVQLTHNVIRGGLACLLVLPCVYLINAVAVQLWKVNHHPVEQMIRANSSPPVFILAFVSAVILAPLAEELVFRGVIQGWLTRLFEERQDRRDLPEILTSDLLPPTAEVGALWTEPAPELVAVMPCPTPEYRPLSRWASAMPIIITSILFAAVHMPQWPAPIAIFALSVALGVLYRRTGSLVPSITLHAVFNGVATIFLFTSLP